MIGQLQETLAPHDDPSSSDLAWMPKRQPRDRTHTDEQFIRHEFNIVLKRCNCADLAGNSITITNKQQQLFALAVLWQDTSKPPRF